MINEFKDLVKKVDNMYKDIGNFCKEMEITKRSEMEVLDMKIAVSKIILLMNLSAEGKQNNWTLAKDKRNNPDSETQI